MVVRYYVYGTMDFQMTSMVKQVQNPGSGFKNDADAYTLMRELVEKFPDKEFSIVKTYRSYKED